MKRTNVDHLLAVVKAGINGVPVVGGPIASLISDYIPDSTQRNIEKAIACLKEELSRLKERLDTDSINREEFAELFKSCYMIMIRSHHEERTNAAISLITNILLKEGDLDKLTYTELDHFVRCLDHLSIGAIRVLANVFQNLNEQQRVNPELESITFQFKGLHDQIPEMDSFLLMGLMGELTSMNLLHIPGVPAIRTKGYDNYSLQLTPLGTRFVKRILEYSD